MFNIPFSWRTLAIGVLLVVLVAVCRLAGYYHGKYVAADGVATERQQTINDMTVRQRDVAALDAKYTKELADANNENDRLRAKLASGGRVRVAGECKPQPSTTGSVGNAGTVELSPVAGSNVLSIRAGIISDQAKVRYLQQYINEQCLR